MPFFKKTAFDRARALAAADQARAKGRTAKAIEGYREILAHHPDDVAVHGKLAPLLARTEPGLEALQSFWAAGQGHEKQGFDDRALAVYAQASQHYPKEIRLWERMVTLQLQRGRRADAVKVLFSARAHFAKRAERPQAIVWLRAILAIEPTHLAATLDLARVLGKQGQREEAVALLQALLAQLPKPQRRQVRRTEFVVAPSLGALWRWWFRA